MEVLTIITLNTLSSVLSQSGLAGDVKVDVCVSVTKSSTAMNHTDVVIDHGLQFIPDSPEEEFNGPTAVFPVARFFDNIGVNPNYKLFFCNRLLNAHHRYVKWNGSTVETGRGPELYSADGTRVPVDKLNFYNTIEDVVRDVRTGGFFPRLTSALLKSGLGIHLVGAKDSILREREKMSTVLSGFMACQEQHHPYRLELSVRFRDGVAAFEALRQAAETGVYSVVSTVDLVDIVIATARSIITV